MQQLEYGQAAARFASAIDLDARTVPAYLNLGDVRLHEENLASAVETWERIAQVAPERAYLAFDRLESAALQQNNAPRFQALCRRLIGANPQDWRARLALGRHLLAQGHGGEALELLFEALSHSPHALTIHQAVWHTLLTAGLDPELVKRYVELMRQSVFYLDPHVCQRCHYHASVAVAMPALSRMGHLRRGSDRARAGGH